MSRVDFFLSTRKTKVGLLIELSTMVPLDHAVLNGKVVGPHQAYGIPVPGGARAGGRGAPVGGPSYGRGEYGRPPPTTPAVARAQVMGFQWDGASV